MHHAECLKCNQCTCKSHQCDMHKIMCKIKDPRSKFRSNYTRGNDGVDKVEEDVLGRRN